MDCSKKRSRAGRSARDVLRFEIEALVEVEFHSIREIPVPSECIMLNIERT